MKKADYIYRILAKAIDFLLVGPLATAGIYGIFSAAIYLVISDGFFSGQSVGKKLIGLQVKVRLSGGDYRNCSFRESIVRNLLFGVIVILGSIPIIGPFIFLPIGVVLTLVEFYFIYVDPLGIRLGDIFASSQVFDAPRVKSATTS